MMMNTNVTRIYDVDNNEFIDFEINGHEEVVTMSISCGIKIVIPYYEFNEFIQYFNDINDLCCKVNIKDGE